MTFRVAAGLLNAYCVWAVAPGVLHPCSPLGPETDAISICISQKLTDKKQTEYWNFYIWSASVVWVRMSPTGSCVPTLGPRLMVLFGWVLKLLSGGAGGGKWGEGQILRVYNLSVLFCFLCKAEMWSSHFLLLVLGFPLWLWTPSFWNHKPQQIPPQPAFALVFHPRDRKVTDTLVSCWNPEFVWRTGSSGLIQSWDSAGWRHASPEFGMESHLLHRMWDFLSPVEWRGSWWWTLGWVRLWKCRHSNTLPSASFGHVVFFPPLWSGIITPSGLLWRLYDNVYKVDSQLVPREWSVFCKFIFYFSPASSPLLWNHWTVFIE